MFLEKYYSYIKARELFSPGSNVLVTVSGGIDSMVMLDLFHQSDVNCSIAHCNFQLRGEESDGDETFVREQAAHYNFQIFVARFETEEYASENQLSIQMAARELRYSWFEKLANAHQFDHIAIGHNLDDSFETFFINMGRGTGIAGLSGINPSSGKIIRPLLFASRNEIAAYAQEYNISFREDSSNASDKYQRNYIRHHILPSFQKIFPNFRSTFSQTILNIEDAYKVYRQTISHSIQQITSEKEGVLFIQINALNASESPQTLLFEILKPYGFSASMANSVFQSASATSGKQFFSSTSKLIKDRDTFIVTKNSKEPLRVKFYIENHTNQLDHPCHLTFEHIVREPSFEIAKQKEMAQLDYEKLEFPLILRRWHPGDYFVPLGMKGMKKLSDFFIDNKFSRIEKENIWLLTSGDQIVWIVGKRIDDRFKVTKDTTHIFQVLLQEGLRI